MFKLYGEPGSGSAVVEAILEEIGAPYHLETVPRDSRRMFPDDFLPINPLRQIPVLVLPDGSKMTESGAIAVYLADQFPKAGLAPAIGDARRGAYLRWMFFLAANIYMTNLRIYYSARYAEGDACAPAVKSAAAARLATEWEVFADALGPGPFILGEALCAADIYAAMLACWHPDVAAFFARHPNIKRMFDGVIARPAINSVWKKNEFI